MNAYESEVLILIETNIILVLIFPLQGGANVMLDVLSTAQLQKDTRQQLQRVPRQQLQRVPRQQLQRVPRQQLQRVPRQQL